MIDIRQSKNYASYLTFLGWKVEKIEGINYFVKTLPLIGSVLKVQRPKRIDFKQIKALSKKYRAFHIILEPKLSTNIGSADHNLIIAHGYKLSQSPYLPSKTLCLDLTRPINLEKETRRAIRIGDRAKIKEYSSPTEIKTFREAWKNSVKFRRFVPSVAQLVNLRKCFPNNYSIFLASHNDVSSIIGGAIFTKSSHSVGYYWQAFTNSQGRSSLSQYSLLYHGILWAKRMGCKVFDFEGIYDPRFPNKSWQGFTHFKKSFGGYEVEYPGCYVKTSLSL
jgi:lipid II:glycine glycyltransferase (peptidoglycan interpeptide bridge formation enzyme)